MPPLEMIDEKDSLGKKMLKTTQLLIIFYPLTRRLPLHVLSMEHLLLPMNVRLHHNESIEQDHF